MHYGDACFLFRPDDYEDWDRARYICKQEGGILASIHSIEENIFIREKLVEVSESPVRRAAWIGLVQTYADGEQTASLVANVATVACFQTKRDLRRCDVLFKL